MEEKRFITPTAIEGIFSQVYADGRKRIGAEVRIIIQEIPEDPNALDPVVLRLNSLLAPDIILFREEVRLSTQEYRFLYCLAENADRVTSGRLIYNEVFGQYSEIPDYQMRVIRTRIMKKLQTQFDTSKVPDTFITAVYSEGYKLNLKKWQVEIV